jgi:DNA-nicking Smr family endonuclease
MRVWRLLLAQGQLEQKAVADLAMLTKEEAREALYAMLKAG